MLRLRMYADHRTTSARFKARGSFLLTMFASCILCLAQAKALEILTDDGSKSSRAETSADIAAGPTSGSAGEGGAAGANNEDDGFELVDAP